MKNTATTTQPACFEPIERLRGLTPYKPPAQSASIDLALDSNEGRAQSNVLSGVLTKFDEAELCRYPCVTELERDLAEKHAVDPARVVVTNGADDAIDRVCRTALEPGRELLVHTPTFVMIERSAHLAGGSVHAAEWKSGPFPVSQLINSFSAKTSLVALVSPNNPTGATIERSAMLAIIRTARDAGALVMVDLAYIEFADEDPTLDLLEEPNVVVIRTFSKAMGLAGARVGYAIASPEVADWLRTTGGPYPVSSLSVALARAVLNNETDRAAFIETVRSERALLSAALLELGCDVLESQANFVTARFSDPSFVQRSLASLGISVRAFSSQPAMSSYLRITLPGDRVAFERLESSLRTILGPEVIR